jgi:hypothetical protein
MDDFERQFSELSFKVAKLKVSLRIKRYRSEDDQNGSEELNGELNPAFHETSPECSPDIVLRRLSISSADSGFSSSLVRSRINSVSSMKVKNTKMMARRASDCFVSADGEFERYFQPILSSVKQPTQTSCPVPKFRISPNDTSDDYSEVFMNNEDIILSDVSINDPDSPPELLPRKMALKPPCRPPYPSHFLKK